MRGKLTLHPESLQIATFETGESLGSLGTVEGREAYVPCPSAGYPLSCSTKHTCASFDVSCRADA